MTDPTNDDDLEFYPFGLRATLNPQLESRAPWIGPSLSGRVGPFTLGDSDSRVADADNARARRPRKAA